MAGTMAAGAARTAAAAAAAAACCGSMIDLQLVSAKTTEQKRNTKAKPLS